MISFWSERGVLKLDCGTAGQVSGLLKITEFTLGISHYFDTYALTNKVGISLVWIGKKEKLAVVIGRPHRRRKFQGYFKA